MINLEDEIRKGALQFMEAVVKEAVYGEHPAQTNRPSFGGIVAIDATDMHVPWLRR